MIYRRHHHRGLVRMSLTFEAEVYRCQEILSGERTGCSRRISPGQRTTRAEPPIPADSRFARQESLLSLACRTCARATNDNGQARHTCTAAWTIPHSCFTGINNRQGN